MIRKFEHGYLMSYLRYGVLNVTNLKHNVPRVNYKADPGNQVFNTEHTLVTPDILSWWTDDSTT